MDSKENEEAIPEPESPTIYPSKVKVFEAVLIEISKESIKSDDNKK